MINNNSNNSLDIYHHLGGLLFLNTEGWGWRWRWGRGGSRFFFYDVTLGKVGTLALCPGALSVRLGTEAGDSVFKWATGTMFLFPSKSMFPCSKLQASLKIKEGKVNLMFVYVTTYLFLYIFPVDTLYARVNRDINRCVWERETERNREWEIKSDKERKRNKER